MYFTHIKMQHSNTYPTPSCCPNKGVLKRHDSAWCATVAAMARPRSVAAQGQIILDAQHCAIVQTPTPKACVVLGRGRSKELLKSHAKHALIKFQTKFSGEKCGRTCPGISLDLHSKWMFRGWKMNELHLPNHRS